VRLRIRPPYAWQPLAAFLAARAIPGVEEVDATRYRRSVPGGIIEIRPRARHLELDGDPRHAPRVRRLFDTGCDPDEVIQVLGRDPTLAPSLAACPGLRVPGSWDGFELAVRAILGQQISVARASALAGELVRAWGVPLRRPRGSLTHTFPPAASVAEAGGDEVARRLGMPRARGHAIADLAAVLAAGTLALDAPYPELVTRLVELPGIGPWTAEYIAMRLGHTDGFPAGDLWLRRALGLDERALRARAERWRPYRAYAALHLWVSPPPSRA